jgi:SAM-dependent methyltransferase
LKITGGITAQQSNFRDFSNILSEIFEQQEKIMTATDPDLLEKIRRQFDSAPYPDDPLEQSPKANSELLFIHNFVTPYYLRNQRVVDTTDRVILDAGCGTGFKSLVLATANPGAKVVGIDLSPASIEFAKSRLQFHGFENVEFHVAAIDELPKLGYQFDYINCDEVLYLLPDLAAGLQVMQSVLSPDGIIRGNLHSALQRVYFYRSQEVFKMMGLFDSNPEDLEIEIAVETLKSLKDFVLLKSQVWSTDFEAKGAKLKVLMNYLFQGDRGYTIPELFAALRSANLEFIGMVNWRQWELLDLFQNPDDLPVFWAMSLPDVSIEQRLHLFELMHPMHRLLDFWCGQPEQAVPFTSPAEWSAAEWQQVTVHLHPQLRTPQVKEDLVQGIAQRGLFEISRYIPKAANAPVNVNSSVAAYLLPLWDGPQPLAALVERSRQIHPLDPITLEPVTSEQAFQEVKEMLVALEVFLYVLLERSQS